MKNKFSVRLHLKRHKIRRAENSFELHQKWCLFLQLAAKKKTPFLVQLKQIFDPSNFDRALDVSQSFWRIWLESNATVSQFVRYPNLAALSPHISSSWICYSWGNCGRRDAFPDASDKKRTQSHCYQVNDCQEPNFNSKR